MLTVILCLHSMLMISCCLNGIAHNCANLKLYSNILFEQINNKGQLSDALREISNGHTEVSSLHCKL